MKRLLFKETDLSTLPTPPAGYVYLGVSSTGEVSTVNTGGTVSSVAGSGSSGGAGLEGSQYVFVSANGTDTENASELQAAYDLAKTKKQVIENYTILSTNVYVSGSSIFIFGISNELTFNGGQTYDIRLDNVTYTGVVDYASYGMFSMSSVTAPDGPYTTMEIGSSQILKSRVIASPGYYNFTSNFLVDEDYVDIVSLDGNRSVIFNGSGTINITANNIFVKGIDVLDKPFKVGMSLNQLFVENCKGGDYSFGGSDVNTSYNETQFLNSTFNHCDGGAHSFGGSYNSNPINISGTFNYCNGGVYSFGRGYGDLSGTFNNCKVTGSGFGYDNSVNLSGVFNNCVVNGVSGFGSTTSTVSGTFNNCKVTGSGFGSSFNSLASGIFKNCEAGSYSFGGFSNGGGVAGCSGVFYNCIGGESSFGKTYQEYPGSLTGKLYYCRLTSGTFETVSGSGRTYYCVDGSGNTNNQ
jgi:hypothetical protein